MRITIQRYHRTWAFDVRMGLGVVDVSPVAYYENNVMRPDFPTPTWLADAVRAEVAKRVFVPWEAP